MAWGIVRPGVTSQERLPVQWTGAAPVVRSRCGPRTNRRQGSEGIEPLTAGFEPDLSSTEKYLSPYASGRMPTMAQRSCRCISVSQVGRLRCDDAREHRGQYGWRRG